jgi:membrane associated rhomboid family serine protease
MIPLKDNIPSRRTPFITWALIALNALAFGGELLLSDAALGRVFYEYGVRPVEYWNLGAFGEPVWTGVALPLLTSMFLHGGFLHAAGNLLFLWVFGDNVEDRFGPWLYLPLYLGFGLAASAAHIALSPESAAPTIGASGAISGVLGAYLVFYPGARVKALLPLGIIMLYRELPAVLFLGAWFLMQILPGILSLGGGGAGGVAWWAHIGGFVVGAGVALLWRLLRPERPERRLPELF